MAKLTSLNPADASEIGSVKIATKAGIEAAVKKARQGFDKWRLVPLKKRGQILVKASVLFKKNKIRLAKLISREMGKPIDEALTEVDDAAANLKWLGIKGFKYLEDEFLEKTAKVVSVLRYEPVGVVACIKPWNFPLVTPIAAVAPALLAGNSVILKPSEYVPLISNEWAKLFWEAGIPKDGLQIVHGRSEVGEMLVDSKIDMVSFTGSTEVGQEIANKCASKLIKFVLELGGSSPAIVCADADLEQAADKIIKARFLNCGQVCCAIKRVLAESRAYNPLIKLLEEKARQVKVGPLVSEKQLLKFEKQITRGIIQGGRIIVGGRRLRDEQHIKGYFHEPTLMIHVTPKMEIMQEETFGPVLPVIEVESFDQAIKLANETEFGLTAAVFTRSKAKINQAIKKLKAGSIYINEAIAFSEGSPWTGLKKSGFGTAGGKHGLWEFTHKKHVYVKR